MFLLCTLSVAAKTLYVNGSLNTDPPPDGLTWATAFNAVQAGIDAAQPGDEVWVAATNYLENLTLKAGVALYGGFRGDEAGRDQRNWTDNPTVLDGRQAGRVILVEEDSTNSPIRIDGFVIQNGRQYDGAGIRCVRAAVTIANNVISNCTDISGTYGGGIYCSTSSVTIVNNQIIKNRAQTGGGIYCEASRFLIAGNRIMENSAWSSAGGGIRVRRSEGFICGNVIARNSSAGSGGGITITDCSPTVSSNHIAGNVCGAEGLGGGIAIVSSRLPLPSPVVSNNLIIGNNGYRGGGIYSASTGASIINNHIICNSAGEYGGGIYSWVWVDLGGALTIHNNTIVGNVGPTVSGLYDPAGTASVVNNLVAFNTCMSSRDGHAVSGVGTGFQHNCVYGNIPLDYYHNSLTGISGNISVEPRLAHPENGDCHLLPDSPCRDAGDTSVVQADWLDADGERRVEGYAVDIGADESMGSIVPFIPTVVRVGPSGDDRMDGTSWASAKRTLQAAIDAVALAGGEVWAAAGTYDERISLRPLVYLYGGFSGIESNRAERDWRNNETILDGMQGGSVVKIRWVNNWSTVDGFTIRNGMADYGGGIFCEKASPSISNNLVISNQAARFGGGIFLSQSSAIVANNRVIANTAGQLGGGVRAGGLVPPLPMIRGNLIRDNVSGSGFNPGSGGGITCSGNSLVVGNSVLRNRSLAPDGGGAEGGGVYLYGDDNHVINNLVAFGSSGIEVWDSVPELRHNCVFGNAALNYSGIPDPTGTNGNLSVDPLLVNTDGDFHLAAGSPCINAGDDSVASRSWVDLDGQVRIAGPSVDIGADEFGSSLPFTLRLLSGSAGTGPTLRLDGEPGRTYVLERSADFTDWTAFSTNHATNGTVMVETPMAGTPGPQLYRGVTSP